MTPDSAFDRHRGMLFGIAYRMLGSVQDAEDVVQEAFIRWQRTDAETVHDPGSFLSTVVTRLSIDALRSARKLRETYVGEWLPEPLVSTGRGPDEELALSESLSTAFLLMLERLNPIERAAFLLHEVFDYNYREVAEIVGKSEANCRQIVKRAKEHVRAPRCRFEAPEDKRMRLLASFVEATNSGNVESLTALLAEDATFHSDHGGKVVANRRTIYGGRKVARFLVGISTRFPVENAHIRVTAINGRPGVLVYEGETPYTAFSIEFDDDCIKTVYAMRNPDKLTHLPAPDLLNESSTH